MNLPRRFPDDGISETAVMKELDKAWEEDLHFKDGEILYSMCNEPTPLALRAHQKFVEANLGDPNLYPGTGSLEKSVVHMLIDLMHGHPKNMGGHVVSGGSEANITALWIYRNLTGKKKIVLPRTAHYSFETAADMLRMDLDYVEVDDTFAMIPKQVEESLRGDDVAVVVAIAGTTEHGQIDPISEIQRICLDSNVNLHVDAAFGGMVFPFLREAGYTETPFFDFTLDGVSSITVDPHKMGQATAPAGALLMREPRWFDEIARDTYYLSADSLQSILGTRSSAGVASAYAMMRNWGKNGFVKELQTCMSMTSALAKNLTDLGFKLAIKPISPVVCIRTGDADTAKRYQTELLKQRWRVSRTKHPAGIRVVMMPHIKREVIAPFVASLQKIRPG